MKLVCGNRYVSEAFADNAASANNDLDVICLKISRFGGEDNIDEFLWDVTNRSAARANKVVVIPDIRVKTDDACFIDFLKQTVVTQKVEGVVDGSTGCHWEAFVDMDTNVFSGWVVERIGYILNNGYPLWCELPALCSNCFTKVF